MDHVDIELDQMLSEQVFGGNGSQVLRNAVYITDITST